MANILIVEDDVELAETVVDLLTGGGHMARMAGNGVEGLQEIAAQLPDLILLDVEMPILDGPGMAEALAIQRAGQPQIPIVVISASPRIQKVAGWIGTPYFLKKPFGIGEVIEIVKQVLAEPAR